MLQSTGSCKNLVVLGVSAALQLLQRIFVVLDLARDCILRESPFRQYWGII